MAFGFEILNSSGNVVLNDRDSPLRLVRERTITTSETANGNSSIYVFSPSTYAESLPFIKFNVGTVVAYDQNTGFIFSNRNSLVLRECSPFIERLPASSGYGMEVRNGSGELIYTSAGNLIPIGVTGTRSENGATVTIASDTDSICLLSCRLEHYMFMNPPGPGIQTRYLGVARTSATVMTMNLFPGHLISGASVPGSVEPKGATRFVTSR